MELAKIEAVKEWLTLKNVKDVRSFVGYVNYYRKFIRNYGKMTAPLTNLIKNDVGFSWTLREQQAFE
jgi:hypothetical protein